MLVELRNIFWILLQTAIFLVKITLVNYSTYVGTFLAFGVK